MPPRRFKGDLYLFVKSYPTKAAAKEYAKALRWRGASARIVPFESDAADGGYAVYARG